MRYEIRDPEGKLIAIHVREDQPDGSKGFRWERPGGVRGLNGIPAAGLPLYGSNLVRGWHRESPIIVTEGEKAADALISRGYSALGTATGASSAPVAGPLEVLRGRDVVLWPDNDQPGRQHMSRIDAALDRSASSIRCVEWGEQPGDDAFDFFARGGTEEQLDQLLAEARNYEGGSGLGDLGEPQSPGSRLVVVSADDFVATRFPEREYILEPILQAKNLGMLHSWRGVGKTVVATGIALAASTGGTFLRWHAPRARRVLYIDGELPQETLQERLRDVATASGLHVSPNLRLLTPDQQPDGVRIPNLADPEGQEVFTNLLDKENPELAILDNLSTLVRSGAENEAEPWQVIQDWLVLQRSRGRTVLMVHHSNKTGGQRGTSKREDVLDLVLKLAHPSDYQEPQGCRVEVTFEKTRGIRGDGAVPFEAWLQESWTVRLLSVVLKRRVHELLDDGMKPGGIAKELGISTSWVYRLKKSLAGGGS